MKKGLLFLMITILILSCIALAEQEPEWVYSNNQGGIGRYNGPGGAVTVPEKAEEHPVRALGDAVFSRNDSVTGLTVPGSVLSLGRSSINGCPNLERVTLSEGLQSIEYNNFGSLPKLTELTIPSTVVMIDYSFSWCDNLRTVTFLGECPVFCNPEFCFIALPEDLTVYVPDDQLEAYRAALINLNPEQVQPSGQNAILHDYTPSPEELEFDAATGAVTGYTGISLRVDLPAEIDGVPVTAIGTYAFEDSRLVAVRIPEGVAIIESMAFDGCNDLQAVNLPNSLKKIGSHAFDGIDGSLIHWGEGLEEIGDGAFRYVGFGADLVLSESLRVIGDEAFYRATLSDVHIGGGIEKIGSQAFADTSLRYLELDAYTMIEVGEDAFADTRLKDVDLPWDCSRENQQAWQELMDSQVEGCKVWINNPPDCDYPEDGSGVYETYPDGTYYLKEYTGARENLVLYHTMDDIQVTGLGDGVFKDNQTLKKYRVTHNDTFTSIGKEAFAGSAVEVVDLYYTTETIGEGAFRNCLGLKEITLPASLKSIGAGAFAGCANLAKVNILCDPAILPADAFEGTAYAAGPEEKPIDLPTIERSEDVLGLWKLSAMIEDGVEYDVALFGIEMTLNLADDGTVIVISEEEQHGEWYLREGVLYISIDGVAVPARMDDQGRLSMQNDGVVMFFVKATEAETPVELPAETPTPAPAATPAPEDPEDTFIPVRPEQYMPMVGDWYGIWIDSGGGQFNPLKEKNYEMILSIREDGTATLTGDSRDPVLQSYNGYVMFGEQPLELIEDGQFLHLGATGSGSMYFSKDPEDEIPEMYRHGLQDYVNSIIQPTPEPAAAPKAEDIPGELRMDVKYLAVTYTAGGYSYDAAILGAEYSLTLHADGTCELVFGGFSVPGVLWTMDGDILRVQYAMGYDCTLNGDALDMDFSGVMLLHMAPQL